MTIPPHIQEMQDMAGFLKVFHEMLAHYRTHEDCYDACERTYHNWFGRNRFADYESFRSSKSYYYKNKK